MLSLLPTWLHRNLHRPPRRAMAVVCLLLVACAAEPEKDGAQDPDRATILIGTPFDMDALNELLSLGSGTNNEIVRRLYLPLLEELPDYQERPPTLAPRLATSFEWSEDHLVLTVHLRQDVVWSDGVPVTAEDVRWTWQAHTSPEVAWPFVSYKEKIADVEVVDDHTVRFHYTHYYPSQLLDANEGLILPKHVWEKLPFAQWRQSPDWFFANAVFNGPFVLESRKPQQEIVLRRNERYHEPGLPRVERVIFRVIADPASLFQQLLSGHVDVVSAVSPSDSHRVEASQEVNLVVFPGRRFHFISWNTGRPLFQDAKVRQALTLGMDRQLIIDTQWRGYAQMSSSPILSNVWAYNSDIDPWPYDPKKAQRILREQGWVDTDGDGIVDRDGVKFSFELTTNPGDLNRIDTIVLLQEQLRRIGVEVRPRQIEFNALNALNAAHEYDATYAAIGMDTSLKLEHMFRTGAQYNWGLYSHPEVDRLLQELEWESDTAKTEKLLHRVQAILHEEQPLTFLLEPARLMGINRRIRNARPNALSELFNLREWYIEP